MGLLCIKFPSYHSITYKTFIFVHSVFNFKSLTSVQKYTIKFHSTTVANSMGVGDDRYIFNP